MVFRRYFGSRYKECKERFRDYTLGIILGDALLLGGLGGIAVGIGSVVASNVYTVRNFYNLRENRISREEFQRIKTWNKNYCDSMGLSAIIGGMTAFGGLVLMTQTISAMRNSSDEKIRKMGNKLLNCALETMYGISEMDESDKIDESDKD